MNGPQEATATRRGGGAAPDADSAKGAELYALGGVRLMRGGVDETAKLGAKHLALLVYLFHERRPMHPSEVTELLGRGQSEEKELEALKRAIAYLADRISGVNIRVVADTVEAVSGVMIDTREVDSAIDGGDPWHVTKLWVGDFLQGFESGAAAFDEWAAKERARLRRAWSNAILAAIRKTEKRGDWETAAQWWQVLVARAPERPEGVAGLMQAFVQAGQLEEASAAYAEYAALVGDQPSGPPEAINNVLTQFPKLARLVREGATSPQKRPRARKREVVRRRPAPEKPTAAEPDMESDAPPVIEHEIVSEAETQAAMPRADVKAGTPKKAVQPAASKRKVEDQKRPPPPPPKPSGEKFRDVRADDPAKSGNGAPEGYEAPEGLERSLVPIDSGPEHDSVAAPSKPTSRRRDPGAAASTDSGVRSAAHEVTSVRRAWGPALREAWDELAPARADAARRARTAAVGFSGLAARLFKNIGSALIRSGRLLKALARGLGAVSRTLVRAVVATAGVVPRLGRKALQSQRQRKERRRRDEGSRVKKVEAKPKQKPKQKAKPKAKLKSIPLAAIVPGLRRFWYVPVGVAAIGVAVIVGPRVIGVAGGIAEDLPEVRAPSLPDVSLPVVSLPKITIPKVKVTAPSFVETSVARIGKIFSGPLLDKPGMWVLVADIEAGGSTREADLAVAIKVALEAELSESQFFNIVPRERALVALDGLAGGGHERLSYADALTLTQEMPYAVVIGGRLLEAGVDDRQVTGRDSSDRAGGEVDDAADSGDAAVVPDSLQVSIYNPSGEELYGVKAELSEDAGWLAVVESIANALRKRLGESGERIKASPGTGEVLSLSVESLAAYDRARTHLYSGRYAQAIGAAREATRHDSAFAAPYQIRAEAYAQVGQRTRGRSMLEAAYQLRRRAPERERLRIEADRLAWDGRDEEAILAYEELFQRYRDDVGALKSEALLQWKIGVRGGGEGNLRVAYTIAPLDWPRLTRIARYLGYQGQLPNVDSLVASIQAADVQLPTVQGSN